MISKGFPPSTWRLILSKDLPGSKNIAMDAAILAGVSRHQSPPTLRLYKPDKPCLSLGVTQSYSTVDEEELTKRGWQVIRRPSGGMAVLHADDLIYTVIGPKSDPRLEGNLSDSCRRMSKAILDALNRLEITGEIHSGKNPEARHQAVCFENPADFEITVNGRKIIGNAQIRELHCLLQHGSLPLTGDLTRIAHVLSYPSAAARQKACEVIVQKATTVAEVLGQEISWERASQAFQAGFSHTLNLTLEEGNLTPSELAEAELLESNQYDHPDWIKGTYSLKAPY